jgi:predicted permease
LLQDLRYAVRFLSRRPWFTLVAVLTVGLGVGANTAVFSLADAVLFRPLPYSHADRLFVLEPLTLSSGQSYNTLALEDLAAVKANGAFDAVIDLDEAESIYIRDGDRVEPLRVQPVPPQYLSVLGVRPAYGRDFDDGDADTTAVLVTYKTFARRYGGNVGILGTTIPAVDGRSMHVIGVLPSSFRTASASPFFRTPDVLMAARPKYGPVSRASTPIARLAADVSPGAAQARLSAIRATELSPGRTELRMVPLRDRMGRFSRPTLVLLSAAALLVLIVGCVNLANLVLARGAERQRELAVRLSLGASTLRITRLLLVEALVVAALGGVVGVAAAYWSFGVLVARLPLSMSRSMAPVFDSRVFVFGFAFAITAGLVAGLLPAWRLARADAQAGPQIANPQARPRSGRKALLSTEISLATVAVIATLVLAQSLADLVTKDLGFDARRLLVSVWAAAPGAAEQDRITRAARLVRQIDSVRTLPAVRSAAAASGLPATGQASDFALFPQPQAHGDVWSISSGFFESMGIPLIEGRDLDDRESFAGAPVGILNRTAARMLFPDGHALGRQVRAPRQPARTIVGIVADSRRSLKKAVEPTMYVPFDRARFRTADIIVDAADSPALREQIRVAINRVSPDTDVRVEPISAVLDQESAVLRFTLTTTAAFALLAVTLAVLGVYGVIAFIAGERLREYGVRVALGATRRAIAMLVVRQAVVPIAIGLAAGLVAAIWTSRILAARILDVLPADPPIFVAAAALLLTSGVLAAALPARRAARVDPMVALRAE